MPPSRLRAAFSLEHRMIDMMALKAANAKRWANAGVNRGAEAVAVAKHLVIAVYKARYQAVAAKTGVPWFIISVIHERESSQDWTGNLAQGDPWDRVSVHVPAGRGPFKSWEDAAIDALVNCAPHAARNKDWGVGGALALLESYNGLGYATRGLPSPYIWSGTDQYTSGKYVRDFVYDPGVVDRQLGCAALLKSMMTLDSTIAFADVAIAPLDTPKLEPAAAPAPKAAPKPSIRNPAKGSIGEAIASGVSAILSILKRK
jgi:lysozyme family protein